MLKHTTIEAKETVNKNHKKILLIIALMLFFGLSIGAYVIYNFKAITNEDLASTSIENSQKINTLEEENKLLLDNLNEANSKIEKLSVKVTQIADVKSAQDSLKLESLPQITPENNSLNASQIVMPEQGELLQNMPTTQVDNELEKSKQNNLIKLILAAVKLRDAVNSSNSFEQELKELKFFAQDKESLLPKITVLEKHAQKGVLSPENLLKDFDKMANEVINTVNKSKETGAFSDKVMFKLYSVVQVRKINADAESMSVDDIVARAYKNLQQSNIKNAINDLEDLDEDAQNVVRNWLENAHAYVDCKEASEEIFFYVSQL
jgi:hypothetical protein